MSYFKAILTRVIFAMHSLFAIYILTIVTSDTTYWGLSIAVIPLLIEAVITLTRRRGKELKWICPSVFLYLLAVVPSVWIMEGVLLEKRQDEYKNISLYFKYELNSSIPLWQQIQTATEALPKSDKQTQLVLAVEQFLPFVLIIGRWIMPAGTLSRDKLSQLLLVYIGLAADIIEFLETYKEDPVKFNGQLIYAVLTLWTWSLLQFVFVITMTRDAQDAIDTIEKEENRSKTRRKLGAKEKTCIEKCCCYGETDTYIDPNMNLGEVSGLIIPQRMEDIEVEDTEPKCQCLESEVWGIMLTLCLQDVPFLVLRMVLIIHFHVFSRTNIFYSFKNALMLSLQIYRLSSLYHERKQTLNAEYEKERERLKNS